MVEKSEDLLILEKNDPDSIIQEMIFLLCTESKKITGLRMIMNDKTISFP